MIALDDIPGDEAARYMGVRGEPDEQLLSLIEKGREMVLKAVRPQYVCREFNILEKEEGIVLAGTPLILPGQEIRKHLSGCSKAVLMAVTLSGEADKLIRQTAITDMALSLAIDSLCSAAVEKACDKAEEEIFSMIEAPYRTWRFSPGYGDLPLELQSDLAALLNAQRRIGLTVTSSSLLIPSKSVTAIIGVSDKPLGEKKKGCAVCSMRESCAYRRTGIRCR